jgi:hypothetical protein
MFLQDIPCEQQKTEKFLLFLNNITFNLRAEITALCRCTGTHVKCVRCATFKVKYFSGALRNL